MQRVMNFVKDGTGFVGTICSPLVEWDENWRSSMDPNLSYDPSEWTAGPIIEYVLFFEQVRDLALQYGWNYWGSGKDNYTVTLSITAEKKICISIKLSPSPGFPYYASFQPEYNPHNVDGSTYTTFVGNNREEACEYLEAFIKKYQTAKLTLSSDMRYTGDDYDYYISRIEAHQKNEKK